MAMSRQRGRPKKNDADVSFTRMWFSGVRVRSGLTSCYAIARELELEQPAGGKGRSTRPRNVKPYETGSRVVAHDIVARAELRYAGTSQYFDSAARSLLRGDVVDVGWIEDRLVSLPQQITSILLHPFVDPVTSRPVALLRAFDEEKAKQLAAVGGLHALEAALLLMRWGELHSTPELRRLAREAYIRTQPSLRADPTIAPFAEELFRLVDHVFPLWLYARPDFRCVALPDPLPRTPTLRSPEQILAEEKSERTTLCLARIELERRILESRLRTIAS